MNVNDLPDRLRSKIDVQDDGCWLWTAATWTTGYPCYTIKSRSHRAHRVVYELLVGPIPEGLTLDHTCRVRHCVCPHHLELATFGENALRGNGAPALNARKTHCKRGHEFTPENTNIVPGGRACRECCRMHSRNHYARKAARAQDQISPVAAISDEPDAACRNELGAEAIAVAEGVRCDASALSLTHIGGQT